MEALRFAQYSRLAADNLARYSGVSNCARLALNSGEFMVALSRSLRCAKAAGSDIFSRLRSCAAWIPAMRLASNSGSLPLRSDQGFMEGLAFKASDRRARSSSEKFFGLPIRAATCAALYSGLSHLALSLARVSNFLAGLLSPVNLANTSGSFILLRCFSLASGLRHGCMGLSMACRNFSLCSSVGECMPSPPSRRFVSGPVPSCMRPMEAMRVFSSCIPSSIEATCRSSTTMLSQPIAIIFCCVSQLRPPLFLGLVRPTRLVSPT